MFWSKTNLLRQHCFVALTVEVSLSSSFLQWVNASTALSTIWRISHQCTLLSYLLYFTFLPYQRVKISFLYSPVCFQSNSLRAVILGPLDHFMQWTKSALWLSENHCSKFETSEEKTFSLCVCVHLMWHVIYWRYFTADTLANNFSAWRTCFIYKQ